MSVHPELNAQKKTATRPMRTRFAPSPTGELHLGHAYSALTAWKATGQSAELFCLRIDDLDHTRCRPAYTKQIKDDLSWLGLQWAETPLVQSKRLQRYAEALEKLKADKLLYPCYLTRREVNSLLSAPHDSSEQTPAPSTRGLLSQAEQHQREINGYVAAWRLDCKAALARTGTLIWQDYAGTSHQVGIDQMPADRGDVVLGRRDIAASYHLSVVLDDADSQVELVARGADLESSTPLHRLLQELLGLPTPVYLHHPLVCDKNGKRLSKRDHDTSLTALRAAGFGPADVIAMMPDFIV